jgi:hypothetical protein
MKKKLFCTSLQKRIIFHLSDLKKKALILNSCIRSGPVSIGFSVN